MEGILNTWHLSRAAGLVAYVLLWASVCLGLLQSSGFMKGLAAPLANIDLHGFLAVGALYATTFHAVILLWDHYMPFTPAGVLIPFASEYKPLLAGLGSVAFYIALGAVVSTYLRTRLSPKVWRGLHQASVLAFLGALVHGVLIGTDTGLPAVGFLYRFTGISVAVLIGYRIVRGVSSYAGSARRG